MSAVVPDRYCAASRSGTCRQERIERNPVEIRRRRAVVPIEKQPDTLVDEPCSERIGGKTKLIRVIFGVPGKGEVHRKADVVVSEVGKQRRHICCHAGVDFPHHLGICTTAETAGVAVRLAAEQVVAAQFRRGQCLGAGEVGIEF